MGYQVDKAKPEDYDDVVDFANYVFSHNQRPHDFPAMLPKLYKREYFMDGIHYIIKEEGKIKAALGAYPLEWEFAGSVLPGRGIGMVSAHPYSRGKGYMTALMKNAMDDMRQDGMVFGCLSGNRQRYEYFDFTPVGCAFTFTFTEASLRHCPGSGESSGLSLKPVGPQDETLLEQIFLMHEAKASRIKRQKEKMFDILSNWGADVFALTEGKRFMGYLVAKAGKNLGEWIISEINMQDLAGLPEMLGLFFREKAVPGLHGIIHVIAGPNEPGKIAILSGFCQTYTQGPAYHLAVFNHLCFIEPFLKLKADQRRLADGSFIFRIDGGSGISLAVEQGIPSIAEKPGCTTEYCFSNLEALHFLFSPQAAFTIPAIQKDPFLQSLLPLPLFFEDADKI